MRFDTVHSLLSFLHREREGVFILEDQATFNKAIIGYDDSSRCLVYDGERLVQIYCRQFGTPLEKASNPKEAEERYMEALDFMSYNISFGKDTPLIWWEYEHDQLEKPVPNGHFAVTNYEEEIRVLPFIASQVSTEYNSGNEKE